MSIDRKQQALVAATIAQALHNGDGRNGISTGAAMLFRNGETHHTEVGALLPAGARKFLFGVALQDVIIQLFASKFDRGVLKFALLGCEIKFHEKGSRTTKG